MTNAAVTQQVTKQEGNALTLKYKDGEKTIVVPSDAIVVNLIPGDKADLKPGAKIFIPAGEECQWHHGSGGGAGGPRRCDSAHVNKAFLSPTARLGGKRHRHRHRLLIDLQINEQTLSIRADLLGGLHRGRTLNRTRE